MRGNVFGDLGGIIDELERLGRLARVQSEVDPAYELAGIAAKFEGAPTAVLFERVKGKTHPVFVGLYWSRELLCDLFRRDERALLAHVRDCIRNWQQRPVDPVVVNAGPVLEVTERRVDLDALPVPTHYLKDGGPYIDAGVVIARDPDTGVRNASVQRFMVVDRDTLAVNIDAGRHLELYLNKAAARGETLPLTINVGVGPSLHFAAATPASMAPAEADELGVASEFEGAPLALVPGTASAVEMAANAMYALECEIVPGELVEEGPFAEVTGYYAIRAPRPVVHVKALHHRKNPVFQTILSGIELFNLVGLLGEANVLSLLKLQVPGVTDVYFSHGGGGFYHAIVQMRQVRAGLSKQAMLAAFASFPSLKMVTVVDDDVNIRDPSDVEWAMAERLDPKTGILIVDRAFGHELNPGFRGSVGTKVGFDATRPFPFTPDYDRIAYKEVVLKDYDIRLPERTPGPRAAAGVTAGEAVGARGRGGRRGRERRRGPAPAPASRGGRKAPR